MSQGSEVSDLWYVKLPNGDVHRVTLDQLDGAFQAGHIDGGTLVLPPDAAAGGWSRLGALLGLDEPPTPTPVAMTVTTVVAPVANSLRPMSFDLSAPSLGDDFDDVPFRRSSGKRWAFAIVGLAAAGAIGFVSMRPPTSGGSDITSMAAAAAMAAPPAAAPATPPVVQAPQAPAPPPSGSLHPIAQGTSASAAATPETSPLNPQFTSRANETKEQKARAAEQARQDRANAVHAASHRTPKYKTTMFTTGGNKYDPLNSNL